MLLHITRLNVIKTIKQFEMYKMKEPFKETHTREGNEYVEAST